MGVLGLWQLLEPVGQPVTLESLENKIFAVDISIWLNQAIKGYRDSKGGALPNAHLISLFSRLCKLLFYKIRPIIVFDGAFPELKKQTIINRQKRREALKQKSNDIAKMVLTNYLVSKNLAKGTEESSSKGVIKPKVKAKDEIYQLPPLPQKQSCEESSERDAVEFKFTNFSKEDIKYLNKIDIESDDFDALPPDVKQEILSTLKESRKHRTWEQSQEMPEDSNEFSNFQMQCLLKKRIVSKKLEQAQNDLRKISAADFVAQYTSDHVLGETNKIMSDDCSHYVLLKRIMKSTQCDSSSKDSGETSSSMMDTKNAFIKDMENIDIENLKPAESDEKVAELALIDNLNEEDIDDPPNASPVSSIKKGISSENESLRSSSSSEVEDSSSSDPIPESSESSIVLANGNSGSSLDTAYPGSATNVPEVGSFTESSDGLTTESTEGLLTESSESLSTESTEGFSTESSDHKMIPYEKFPTKLTVSFLQEGLSEESSEDEIIAGLPSKLTVSFLEEGLSDESSTDYLIPRKEATTENLSSKPCSNPTVDQQLNLISENVDSPKQNTIEKSILQKDDTVKSDNLGINSSAKSSDMKTESTKLSSTDVTSINNDYKSATTTSTLISSVSFKNFDPSSVTSELVEVSTSVVPTTPIQTSLEANPETIRKNLEMQKNLDADNLILEANKAKLDRQNRTVQEHMIEECKELLTLFGIPFVVSPTEAEAQCAFFDMANLTHGTITDDSDVWLFGGKRVYKNFFAQKKFVEFYKDHEVFSHFGLSRNKLINFAMLTGSDYTEGIEGVGRVTAMEIISEFPGDGLDALEKFKDWWIKCNNYAHPPENKVRTKLLKLVLGESFPEDKIAEAYLKPDIDESTEKFSWGRPDLDILRDYTREKFGWNKAKVDDVLLPVIKRLGERDSQTHLDSFFTVSLKKQTELFPSKRMMSAVKKITSPQKEGSSVEVTKRKGGAVKRAVKRKAVCRGNKSKPQEPVLSEESSDES